MWANGRVEVERRRPIAAGPVALRIARKRTNLLPLFVDLALQQYLASHPMVSSAGSASSEPAPVVLGHTAACPSRVLGKRRIVSEHAKLVVDDRRGLLQDLRVVRLDSEPSEARRDIENVDLEARENPYIAVT